MKEQEKQLTELEKLTQEICGCGITFYASDKCANCDNYSGYGMPLCDTCENLPVFKSLNSKQKEFKSMGSGPYWKVPYSPNGKDATGEVVQKESSSFSRTRDENYI